MQQDKAILYRHRYRQQATLLVIVSIKSWSKRTCSYTAISTFGDASHPSSRRQSVGEETPQLQIPVFPLCGHRSTYYIQTQAGTYVRTYVCTPPCICVKRCLALDKGIQYKTELDTNVVLTLTTVHVCMCIATDQRQWPNDRSGLGHIKENSSEQLTQNVLRKSSTLDPAAWIRASWLSM